MMMDRTTRRGFFLAALLAMAVLIGLGFLYFHAKNEATPPSEEPETVVPEIPSGWNTTTTQGVTYAYPRTLGMTYVHETDWPPAVTLSDESFSCVEAGLTNESGGQTAGTWLTPDQPACVTLRSEGAAGSTYRLYTYAIPQPEGQILITFGLRYPQCMNYDEPERSACATEQEAFDPDALILSIYKTLKTE